MKTLLAVTLLAIPALAWGQALPWEPDSLGNHRAVVRVTESADAVLAHLEWRRRDRKPEDVRVMVVDAKTNARLQNVARMEMNREFGDIVFQPPTVPGTYYVYYLPYTGTFRSPYPKLTYRPPDDRGDRAWLLRNALTPDNARWLGYRQLPQAAVQRFESIDAFTSFTAMERIASKAQVDLMLSRYAWAEFFLFPESAANSIRMRDDLPEKWAVDGPFLAYQGVADRNESHAFQVGVWAHRVGLNELTVTWSALRGRGGQEIPASAISSFNTEGVNWAGRRFRRAPAVPKGTVQALWFAVDVDSAIPPDLYEGDLTIGAVGVRARNIRVALRVTDRVVPNHGDDDPARLTRLRWLNSQLAASDEVVKPYIPMRVRGSTVSVLGRALTFGADGMPARVTSFFAPTVTEIGSLGREVLAAPMRLEVHDSTGTPLRWAGSPAQIATQNDGAVEWRAARTAGALSMDVRARMEFEGTTEYRVTLKATTRTTLGDVRLHVPFREDAARYMMGLGHKGGRRPQVYRWVWDVARKNQDAVWLGDVNAGMQLTLIDEHYVRPLNTNFYLSKPLVLPRSWGNGGRGGCDVMGDGRRETGDGSPGAQGGGASRESGTRGANARPRATEGSNDLMVELSCFSGMHTLAPGDSLRFDFRLMLTPFKPIDTESQWRTRFFHAFVPVDSIAGRGANTINVHHANAVNPWINYPFLEPGRMKAYVDTAHARGMRVKIYYTVREISNHAPEVFMLKSLGDEVLASGPGGGGAWLQEHVSADYISAWHVPEIRDAAIVTSGVSRWHNFYVEGLAWLVKNVGIDGLYIDDVAFDRTTMKRVRRVLDGGRPDALVDLHSANQYNERDGFASSANLYLEHFPFIDRLWFGEYFDYNAMPDYWLVELSGIPFGLMGEMLEKGGNPWRGMTFGMTNRMPWSGDPSALWKAWDTFGMAGSRMIGWWTPQAPVRSSDPQVLATTYVARGKAFIALGNWSSDARRVRLAVDWKALGITPARARLSAAAIKDYQEAGSWAPGAEIVVPAGRGLLLLLQ